MTFFELEATDISSLNDSDLRELVARLCEAELIRQGIAASSVTWGGAQEAADGGLDVKVQCVGAIPTHNFVPRANTGFQVKKHSMGKSACKKEMLDNGKAKPILNTLASLNGAYIIVSGKDDCSEKMVSERLEGMRQAADLLQQGDLLLDFYGRDRLMNWLRLHPSVALWVRSRLGKPLAGWSPYARWAATPKSSDDAFLVDDHLCVIDTNSVSKTPISATAGIQLTRSKLRKTGSTVRITGLSGVGKTRFAQALFEADIGTDALPTSDAIYADLGDDLTPTASELLSYLIANNFDSYLILDNCPPDVHRRLQKQVAQTNTNLHLLTIEYDISDDKPEETEVIHLEPASELVASKLVLKRYPKIGQVNANRIAEFSNGNARIALALASRVSTDETLSNFSDEDLFRRLFMQRKGISADLLQSAEALALVYSFNLSESSFNNELKTLGVIAGLDRQVLFRGQAELQRRQLVQQRGSWRAILPHALANRLAKRALENISSCNINEELFRPENLRLFQSCAHRIGYLHDFMPARDLAHTWIQSGGPLHDIAYCNEEHLVILDYIAPVFPKTVLNLIQKASYETGFCTRENKNFYKIVNLLCSIAYDNEDFEQSAKIILQFATSEREDETNNSIITRFSQLFSLYLSGTEATPERRQAFIKNLIKSETPLHRAIATKLLSSAFQASHWSSHSSFHFGARTRGSGWQPKNQAERITWYSGFINLLLPAMQSTRCDDRDWAKSVLAKHFRSLWSFVGCFDVLEEIIQIHGCNGGWSDVWISIRQTINFDGDQLDPDILNRLKALERLSAPADPYSEIEAYVLTDIWDHADVRGKDSDESTRIVSEKATNLGAFTASNLSYLDRLGPKLWGARSHSLWAFGRGLASGSTEWFSLFHRLVTSFETHRPEQFGLDLILGYISGLHDVEPHLARELLEPAIDLASLRPYAVAMLCAIPIAPWTSKLLLLLAQSRDLEAWRFEQISYGRLHEAVSDKDLAPILSSILTLEKGYLSVIQILSMRFFGHDGKGYSPSQEILALGRTTLRHFVSAHRDEFRHAQLHSAPRVFNVSFNSSAPIDEAREIIELLCEGVANYRLYAYDLEKIISILLKKYPELILSTVFDGKPNEKKLSYLLFKDRIGHKGVTLNDIPFERLLEWCDGNQERIIKLSNAVHTFSSALPADTTDEDSVDMELSGHIKGLMKVATDKLAVLEIIFQNVIPDSWSSPLSEILENRSKSLEQLLYHSLPEIQSITRNKLDLLQTRIDREREREAADHNEREQRFE